MKRNLKAVLSTLLALLLVLASLPVSALPKFETEVDKNEIEPYWTVPAGYNAHDYNKCVQFLEQTDDEGVKNGEKLSCDYDPNDPDTWFSDYIQNWVFQWNYYNGKLMLTYAHLWNDEGFEGDTIPRLYGSLDLSGCELLCIVDCRYNRLNELDVSNCDYLSDIFIDENNLSNLNVSGCTGLEYLSCSYNDLTELDVSDCTMLDWLDCDYNNLSELDLTNNASLCTLNCRSNSLSELDLSNNTALETLDCRSNSLSELDLSNNTALTSLNCASNDLTELNVTNNTALTYLYCESNNLSELSLTNNALLNRLYCSRNNLSELDLSSCTALNRFECFHNNLSELDLSNNPNFEYDFILAEGNGFIGYERGSNAYWGYVCAYPSENAVFEGFYNENGDLISEGVSSSWPGGYSYKYEVATVSGTIIARFSGGEATPGDFDGDGEVSITDALILMRFCIEAQSGNQIDTEAADINGDGVVDLIDALIVLRMALVTN